MFEAMKKLKDLKVKLSRQINQTLFGDDLGKHLGSGILHNINHLLGLHSLSEWLPYQFYDPETEIFGSFEESVGEIN